MIKPEILHFSVRHPVFEYAWDSVSVPMITKLPELRKWLCEYD